MRNLRWALVKSVGTFLWGLKEGGLRGLGQPIQKGLAQMVHNGRLTKVRVAEFHSSCLESSLVKAIVGVASWVEYGTNGAYEALLEEVFKYPYLGICSFLALGVGVILLLLLFVGEKTRGMLLIGTWWHSRGFFFVNEEEMVDPLRIIGVVGKEREASFDLEKGFKEFEGGELPIEVVERVLEEDNRSVLGSWMKGNFVKLCRCLGMLTKGFEGEILMLLRRMEE